MHLLVEQKLAEVRIIPGWLFLSRVACFFICRRLISIRSFHLLCIRRDTVLHFLVFALSFCIFALSFCALPLAFLLAFLLAFSLCFFLATLLICLFCTNSS